MLLAELVLALDLRAGVVGVVLTAGGLASLPVILLAGRFADRRGTTGLLRLAALVAGGGLAALALASSSLAFAAGALTFLVGFGAVDVAVNARAVALEQHLQRAVLGPAYAAFSAGALVATVATGLALAAGVGFRPLLVAGALPVLALVAARQRPWPAAASPSTAEVMRTAGSVPRVLVLLAGVVALAFVVQGTLEQWTTIYLRTDLGLGDGAAWTGLAVFHGSMLAGRTLALGVTQRVGRERLLRGAGVLIALGMGAALATTALSVVLAGVLLTGLASSVLAPAATSLAGDRAPDRSGATAALLATAGYGTALVAPAVVGGLADVASLRAALGVVVLAGVLLALLGGPATRPPDRGSG